MTPSRGPAGWLFDVRRIVPTHFRAIFVFSLAINILMLVSPLYMLQVYDRVLSSGSFDSLLWLTLIAIFLLAIYAAAEAGRRRVSALAAQAIESEFAPRMFARFERADDARPELVSDAQQLSKLSAVFQNGAVLAFFDLPFAPLFVVVLFLLHPVLGLLGLGGAAVVFVLALKAELATRPVAQQAAEANGRAMDFATGLVRQRSAMIAMGVIGRGYGRWAALRDAAEARALDSSDREAGYSGVSKSVRQIFQVLVLATGAGLVLVHAMSPGGIVASSILIARAMAPLDQITGGWRQIVQAASAWEALNRRLGGVDPDLSYTPLPRPEPAFQISRLSVALPGSAEPLIRPFNYDIVAGTRIAVVGANGSGKTTLLQTLAGVIPPASGSVILGGRNLHRWPSRDRGQYVGYVPQDIELMQATVADNIARLAPDTQVEAIAAARLAGAHETILALPMSYDTPVGPGGARLSAGQTQLIGLARAIFGGPAVLLLDEPTANLDPDSARAVLRAFGAFSEEGGIVIAATHDPRLIAAFDVVLTVRNGAVEAQNVPDYLTPVSAVAGAGR